MKPIAANIDQLLLIIAPQPAPSSGLIDDYLVMAEALGIKPVIVFNKIDLLSDAAYKHWQTELAHYQQLSYPLIFISTLQPAAFSQLNPLLNQHTNILVGQSGVGKSSIIQSLFPTLDIRVSELSTHSQHGKHTTTTTYLYHLPCGGHLIDSPGVRSFSLWSMPSNQIAHCFIEFRPYLNHCRFKNCQHRTEPDCAVLAALMEGKIEKKRYESYLRLQQCSILKRK
jgi:ribosome biogenesis GTPase